MPETQNPPLRRERLDDLLHEVLKRVEGIIDEQERWRLLLEAAVTMAADLSLDELLSRIVRIAANLSGARYAALGVLDEDHPDRLRMFITHGLNEEQRMSIGDLPTGHGLLGLLIERPEPLRLSEIAAHPASYGFPANHPPMTSFLGVPLLIRDKIFGNVYLTDKAGGEDFSAEDEQIVIALAATAGVAVENARLHQQAQRREAWLSATAEITGVLAGSGASSDALQTIVDRARELSHADVAWIIADDRDRLMVEAVSGATVDPEAWTELNMSHSLARLVAQSGQLATVDDFSEDPRVVDISSIMGGPRLGPALLVPLRTRSGTSGVLAFGWTPQNRSAYTDLDPALPTNFAEHTALALEIARSKRDEQRLALFEDRDRIARDLHDIVIQRLFAVGLSLQAGVRAELGPDNQVRLDNVVDELDATIREIRSTIFALSTLDRGDTDLQSEIGRIVERSSTSLGFRPHLQLSGPIRTAVPTDMASDLIAVVVELLSNAARHAKATSVGVSIEVDENLRLQVTDDGVGIPDEAPRRGLLNVLQRAERWKGTFAVEAQPGGGTDFTWLVPLKKRSS